MKPTATHLSGRFIGRRYQLLELLGEGGMGSAWKVRDRLTDQLITLKRGQSPAAKQADMDSWGSFSHGDEVLDSGSMATMDPPGTPPLAPGLIPENAYTGETTYASNAGEVGFGIGSSSDSTAFGETAYGHTLLSGEGLVRIERTEEALASVRTSTDWGEVSLDPRMRLALAQEFEVLAGLRHPNIISVLDYGFDERQQPFFTMELVANAKDFDEACQNRSLIQKADFLRQTLEALVYLHRRGVIHRDIKPNNVLVSGDVVKVLDFGISLTRENIEQEGTGGLAGTFGFIAPEVLCGGDPSELSDLYGVGVMAARAFFGKVPYMLDEVLPSEYPDDDPQMLDAVVLAIRKLAATDPEARYQSATEAITALSEAIHQPLPPEGDDARESFLQAADFVGRHKELGELLDMFRAAQGGQGAVALVAGESGVGKSRLLRELRTQALVRGGLVLRGQTVRHGASAFHLWRELASRLVLTTRLSIGEAAILKELVPDIGRLLGMPGDAVPDAPVADPDAVKKRLLESLEEILRRQRQTVLIILEDLQWATPESLGALAQLKQAVSTMPVLIIGNYRDDEVNRVAEFLPDTVPIKLPRLDDESIAALSASILGETGKDEAILSVLRKETEGNPFFLVELVRAYAQIAGRLDEIAGIDLTQKLLPDGISSLVRQRLDRLSARDRGLLHLISILGRELDMPVIEAMEPGLDWTSILSDWLDAAVVDIIDGQPRFAHDKIREQLVGEIEQAGGRVSMHRRAASAIESVHGDDPDFTGALAYHWSQARDSVKASEYTGIAAERAVGIGATTEAIRILERSLALMDEIEPQQPAGDPAPMRYATELFGVGRMPDRTGIKFRRGRLEGLMAEARSQLGELKTALVHGRKALDALGMPMPETKSEYILGLVGQAAVRGLQAWLPSVYEERDESAIKTRRMATAIQTRITENFFYTQESMPLFWSACRTLNLGEPAGPSRELARGYILVGVVFGIMPQHQLAEICCERALEIAREVGEPYEIGFVGQRTAVYNIYVARWRQVEEGLDEVLRVAHEVKNGRQITESTTIRGHTHLYQGQFEDGARTYGSVVEVATQNEDAQAKLWASSGACFNLIRLRKHDEAQAMFDIATSCMSEEIASADVINYHGMAAMLAARRQAPAEVLESVTKALEYIDQGTPVAFWTHYGLTTVAESCLLALKIPGLTAADKATLEGYAERTCKAVAAFGKKFPFGEPAALLWEGIRQHHKGDRRAAIKALKECTETAADRAMPYEQGRAYLQLSAIESGEDAAVHLRRALGLLAPLGALAPDASEAKSAADVVVG